MMRYDTIPSTYLLTGTCTERKKSTSLQVQVRVSLFALDFPRIPLRHAFRDFSVALHRPDLRDFGFQNPKVVSFVFLPGGLPHAQLEQHLLRGRHFFQQIVVAHGFEVVGFGGFDAGERIGRRRRLLVALRGPDHVRDARGFAGHHRARLEGGGKWEGRERSGKVRDA